MNLKKLFDDIQGHPLVVALIFFVVVFVVYNLLKKKPAAPATPATGTLPTVQDTYAQQYNQYPTVNTGGGAVINQPSGVGTLAPPAPPVPAPPVPTPSTYHGVLTVSGSRHPANIGPWIGGRHVQYGGTWYILHPGPSGHLWGDVIGGATGVLLWDGSDYGH